MTREEAVERFNGIINAMSISIAQSKFYPSKAELDELCDMAITALSAEYEDYEHATLVDIKEPLKKPSAEAEPKITKVRKDGTLFVTVLDAEKVKKVFVNDLQGFYNTFCEEPKQDDDSDYNSLVPDEYKTEPSDLISRADALQCKPEFLNPNPNDKPNNYPIGWNDAIKVWYADIKSLPSADADYKPHIRLINANALIDLLKARKQFFVDAYGGSFHCMSEKDKAKCDEIDACIASIVNAQTVSADTVQGEWKHTITWQPYCSNCEYVFGEDEEFSPFWEYCPMCGARMKGGDDE